MKKSVALAGIAAMTLLDISAATPVAAQNADAFRGSYVGAHAGLFTTDNIPFSGNAYSILGMPTDTGTPIPVSGRNDKFEIDGPFGGVHGGFNVITNGNLMFGIEGDWSYLGQSDSVSSTENVTVNGDGYIFQHRSEVDLEWQGTIRGRAGFTTGNALYFATAGIAFLNADWKENAIATDCNGAVCNNGDDLTFTRNHSSGETLTGLVVGAGVEFAVAPNIIVGGDYLYENFGSFGSVPFGHTGPTQTTIQNGRLGDIDVHKVRVRVSLKFGGGPQ